MEQRTDVIVIGAGPVGLTLAINLKRLGLSVRILDKASQTKREQRACVIWPRSTEILAGLDLIDDFVEASATFNRATVYANGRRLGAMELGSSQSLYPRPLVIEQNTIEHLLAVDLARLGVDVEWETEATDIVEIEQGVHVTIAHADGRQEVIEGRWVVSCEGTRSIVREKMGIVFEGRKRPNLQALQINARPHWHYPSPPNEGYFFLAPEVSLGVFALPTGGYRFFCFTTDPDPDRHGPPTVEEMRTLIADVAHAPELELELTEPLWISRARFQDRIATTLRKGRVLLAGDTAHAWAPIGGHGMNAGIRGAQNLAWKLAAVHRGEAHESLLETYSDEQRATAQAVMREMRFNILELPLPALGLQAVASLLPLALPSKTLQHTIDHTLSDLGMHHRQSKLSDQHAAIGHYHAGDYLPDVAVIADGARATLHSLFSFSHWTLLLYGSSSTPQAEEPIHSLLHHYTAPIKTVSVTPADATATHHLGQKERLVLVRPDGHIGLAAASDDIVALRHYLDIWFVPMGYVSFPDTQEVSVR